MTPPQSRVFAIEFESMGDLHVKVFTHVREEIGEEKKKIY